MFEFKISAQDTKSKARTGEFKTSHGILRTPALAIVGTEGQIKSIPPDVAKTLPLNYTIVNTFHMWTKGIIPQVVGGADLRPLQKTVHQYGGFPGVVASDSGGFQVFSLGFGKAHKVGKLAKNYIDSGSESPIGRRSGMTNKDPQINYDLDNPLTITEEGVTFEWNSPTSSTTTSGLRGTSKKITLTPELSMELQHKISADIMFSFDECTSPLNSKEYVANSVERTDRWLERCIKAHSNVNVIARTALSAGRSPDFIEDPRRSRDNPITNNPTVDSLRDCRVAHKQSLLAMTSNPQALFAIVQGSEWPDLRIKSAQMCAKRDVLGFGIGGSFGSSFGDSKKNMHQVLEWIIPHLPDEKPRHLLGIGQVDDLFESVERGVDLFDCVIPTREARHRVLYTKYGKKEVKKIKTLEEPIAIDCKCIACTQKITGRQLYGLFLQKDPRAFFYTTVHNIQFFADLMEDIGEAIKTNRFQEIKSDYLKYF